MLGSNRKGGVHGVWKHPPPFPRPRENCSLLYLQSKIIENRSHPPSLFTACLHNMVE